MHTTIETKNRKIVNITSFLEETATLPHRIKISKWFQCPINTFTYDFGRFTKFSSEMGPFEK